MIDCFGCSEWIATFMFFASGSGRAVAYQTIWISSGLALLLLIVATLVLVENFIMPYVVDGTAPRARILCLPLIPLYYEGDLTTKKFTHTVNWYRYFPKDTRRSILHRCQAISPENPTNGTEAGIRCASCLDLTSSSICLFICKQSSRLYPLSQWKSQYLFLFLDFGAPNIGGRVIKVPFPASIASISLGVFVSGMNQSFLQSIGRRLKSFAQSFALGMVYGNLVASTVVPFFWID
ncbi:hypothetical protein Tco_0687467 [Tanacetum coccineum]